MMRRCYLRGVRSYLLERVHQKLHAQTFSATMEAVGSVNATQTIAVLLFVTQIAIQRQTVQLELLPQARCVH
jgi:hypothetical protein